MSYYAQVKTSIRLMREQLDRLEEAVNHFEHAVLPKGNHPGVIREEEVDVAVALYTKGLGLEPVARRLGYNMRMVRDALESRGVRIRSRGGRRKPPPPHETRQ